MDARRWNTIQTAFEEILELDAAARVIKLTELGSTDPELRTAVESLLVADAAAAERLAPVETLLGAGPVKPLADLFGLTGRIVAHFRVLEPLGAGGMGMVYRAEDTRLGRPVALKFLLPQTSLDASAKARFLHEAHAAAALDHPNLCTIYEVGESDDGRLFLAMALYSGDTLKARLARQGPLSVPEALGIARQIAHGLGCAHAAGIVHRDLKPGNVMLLPDGAVKILDFGLAKARDESMSASSARLGTAAYMAPEQIRGDAVDGRTDLWALGVVLYEMLTGRKPFAGENDAAIAHAILHQEPDLTAIPDALEEIVLTLLEKQLTKRYRTAAQLLDALDAVPRTSARTAPNKWRRLLRDKRRTRLGAGALSIAVVFALGVWGITELRTSTPAIRSLAVLPLDNLTGHADQEYFVEGMHEALIAELAKISGLKVISRTSAMLYKGVRKPPPEIARELGVDGIIEGAVSREGDQVRITVQVIQGPSANILWSDSYRRELHDVLALQSDLALEIARQVRVRLTSAEERRFARARAVQPEAYDLYLRGRHFKHQEELENAWPLARAAFEKSVALDSSFAPAWAGLAMMDALRAYERWPDSAAPAKTAVEKALALDPNQSDAYVSLALVRQLLDWDWKGAEDAFRRALELAPNNWEAHYEYGWLLIRLGRSDEAFAAAQRALALEPLSATAHHGVAALQFIARQYDDAVATCRKALDLFPNSPLLQRVCADALRLAGFKEESERADRKAWALCCGTSDAQYETLRPVRFRRYVSSGQRVQALELLASWEKAEPQGPVTMAGRYLELGAREDALRVLEEAVDKRRGGVNMMKASPGLTDLHPEPRFRALLKRLDLDPPWEPPKSQ